MFETLADPPQQPWNPAADQVPEATPRFPESPFDVTHSDVWRKAILRSPETHPNRLTACPPSYSFE